MERDNGFEMTFTDSDSCTFYQISSKAYPRFRFIQDRLQSFYPRFLKTIEKLPTILKWMDLVENIGKTVPPLLENKPEIIMFGPNHTLVQKDSILANKSGLEEMDCSMTIIKRNELLQNLSASKPQVLVYTCAADQVMKVSRHLERELSACGLDSVLLLPDVKGFNKEEVHGVLEEVFKSMSDASRDLWIDKVIINLSDQSLSSGISNNLEMRLVREFQKIDSCIGEILSIRRQFQVVVFEEDYLVSSLINGILQNRMLVKDLMDAAYDAVGSAYFMAIQKQIIYFIERAVATQFSLEYKIATGSVHTILEDFKFPKKCMRQVSRAASNSLESEVSTIYRESPTFGDDRSIETDEKGTEKMETDQKSQTSKRNQLYKKNLREKAKMFVDDLQEVINNAELLIHSVSEILTILSQMQFEVKGILSNTIIYSEDERNISTSRKHERSEGTTTDEKKTVDPLEFWIDKLMSLNEVQGCGDYFGKLVVFISDPGSIDEKRDVFETIGKCLAGYPFDYDVKVVNMPFQTKTFSDPDQQDNIYDRMAAVAFKAGQRVRFEDRYGTLGLFVNDRSNESVYFVTNGHVVSFTGTQQVHIINEDDSTTEIGRHTWKYLENVIDIGVVKVQENLVQRCDLTFEDQYGNHCPYMMLDTSKFPRGKLIGKQVLKRGAQTGRTFGIISSENMKFKEEGIIKIYNYIISPLREPGIDAVFAEEGDSGSVVSLCTIDTNPISIIAMLIGGKFESRPANSKVRDFSLHMAGTEKFYLTFSLMDGIDALNERYELNLDIDS